MCWRPPVHLQGRQLCLASIAAAGIPSRCLQYALKQHAIRPPQAFVAEYEKFPMFSSGEGRRRIANLDEFDECREEVASLSAAYRSLESVPEP